MNGSSTAILSIWLEQNGDFKELLWSRSGSLGNIWRYAHVTVVSETNFQLTIEGISIYCNHF